jgi:hypothetical protein
MQQYIPPSSSPIYTYGNIKICTFVELPPYFCISSTTRILPHGLVCPVECIESDFSEKNEEC